MGKTYHGEGSHKLTALERQQVHQATENYKLFKKKQGKAIGRKTAEQVTKRSEQSIVRRRKAGQGKSY